MQAANAAIMQCGTEQADQPGQILTAGPMSVEFDNGQLRYLRVHGVEVLRAIGFLVRDENWGTYTPQISALKIDQGDDQFSVSFHAVCQREGQQIAYEATINGLVSGELRFECSATPSSDFLTARTGFVVLHPLAGVAGQPVRVEHVDGTVVDDHFPERVDPVQPFLAVRALTHTIAPGLEATVLMQGDTFEMEDHRNWTDASFKTYVRPLSLPWPYTLKAGQEVRQSISVSLKGQAAPEQQGDGDGAVRIALGDRLSNSLAPIGLALPAEEISHTLAHSKWLQALAPRYLVCPFDPREHHGLEQLCAYRQACEACGAQAVLEVVVDQVEGFEPELQQLASLVQKSGLILSSVQVVPSGDLKSVLPGGERPPAPDLTDLYAAARKAFPGIPLGGGMLSFFTELNRKRVPVEQLDYVHNTTCAIVHAADDRSVMETLEALPYQVATAKEFIGDRHYRIGPSGIGCRDNPHGATWTPNPTNQRVCLTKHDPRQRGLFAAAWTMGYIATLAKTGIDAISIGATTGPLGAIYRKAEHAQPWFDSLLGDAVFPVYHVLRDMLAGVGSVLLKAHSSQPTVVQSFAYCLDEGDTIVWLANMTANERAVELPLPADCTLSGWLLDQTSFAAACTEPLVFASSDQSMASPITLGPYAVARLRISGKKAA